MPGVAIDPRIQEEGHYAYDRKSLPTKVGANARGLLWYRSDYELRYLRSAKLCRVKLEKSFKLAAKVPDLDAMIAASKELREWADAEARILRIPRPASQPIKTSTRMQAPVVELEQPAPISTPEVKPEQG